MSIAKSNGLFGRLDLSLLRYFFAVASFGGFSKASRATGVSQPSLSLGLKRLEQAIKVPLIDRGATPFSLTPAGLKLLCFCQELEGGLDNLMTTLGMGEERSRPRFRVGVALSIGNSPIVKLCQSAQGDNPFDLEITAGSSMQLLSHLHNGIIDAALVSDEASDERLKLFRIREDKMALVASKENAKLLRRRGVDQAIQQMALVNYARDTAMRFVVDRLCIKEQLKFRNIIATSGVDSLKTLVAQGAGVGFMLRSLAEDEVADGSLTIVDDLIFALPKSGIMLAVRPSDHSSELTQRIRGVWKAVRVQL